VTSVSAWISDAIFPPLATVTELGFTQLPCQEVLTLCRCTCRPKLRAQHKGPSPMQHLIHRRCLGWDASLPMQIE
jgi:hypothetical protein